MSKEHGEMFLSHSESCPPDKFLLAEVDKEIKINEEIKNGELKFIFCSFDGSLGDRLIAIGIIRKENKEGRDVLLITNPLIEPKF